MANKIVPLTTADIPETLALARKVVHKDFPEYSPEVSRIYAEGYFTSEYFQKMIEKETDAVLGIKKDGQLVGIITLKGDYGGVLYIDFLGVAKSFRQKGLGKILLAAAEKWSLAHKYHYLWLNTESQKNIDYYRRRGFEYVGVHRKSWFGADEHIMGKLLREKPFPEAFRNYRQYF